MACKGSTTCDIALTINVLDGSTLTEITSAATSTSTPLTDQDQLLVPTTLSSGNGRYLLRGCYNEIPPGTSGLALGQDGSFYSPIFPSADDYLTVNRCLEGCGAGIAPNKALGYKYAALENGRECYCGMTISSLSVPSLEIFCSSPCIGDSAISCGGPGYLALYELEVADSSISIADIPTDTATSTAAEVSTTEVPTPESPSSSPLSNVQLTSTITSSSESSSTAASKSSTAPTLQTGGSSPDGLSRKAQIGLAVGIAVPVACLGLLTLLLIWWRRKRTQRRRGDSMTLAGSAVVPVVGAGKRSSATSDNEKSTDESTTSPSKLSSDLVRGGTVKGTIVRGKFTADPEDRKRDTLEAWKSGEVPSIIVTLATDSDGDSFEERLRQDRGFDDDPDLWSLDDEPARCAYESAGGQDQTAEAGGGGVRMAEDPDTMAADEGSPGVNTSANAEKHVIGRAV
ncbi:WSC domain-containing protein [Phlyctema vagabunda]|uniref:WSC domain-containing protein n=1 Tax=Phlyctema vagabunda TaxID=108571 RepID=A0ABR4P697_9HELO